MNDDLNGRQSRGVTEPAGETVARRLAAVAEREYNGARGGALSPSPCEGTLPLNAGEKKGGLRPPFFYFISFFILSFTASRMRSISAAVCGQSSKVIFFPYAASITRTVSSLPQSDSHSFIARMSEIPS